MTLEEQITELENEISSYTTILINQSGYKRIVGAGNEGVTQGCNRQVKLKELRKEARERWGKAKVQKTQGYSR